MRVKETVVEVMGFLVSAAWVLGEAQQLGVDTGATAIRRDFDRIRREQFPKRAEFRRFLRESGQTIPDLLLRVRLNLDASAIQRHATAGKSGAAAQSALSEFVKSFRSKWRAQTACVPAYAIPECGVVEAPL
jgi:foldase protein PrsA